MKLNNWPIPPAPTPHLLNTSEGKLQSAMFQWAWNAYPQFRRMLFHVNQKSRNAIEGNKMRAMGVVKGPSDLVLLAPAGRVVWIEVKVPQVGALQAASLGIQSRAAGQQSPEQVEFQRKAEAWGHEYVVVETLAAFQGVVVRHWGAPSAGVAPGFVEVIY